MMGCAGPWTTIFWTPTWSRNESASRWAGGAPERPRRRRLIGCLRDRRAAVCPGPGLLELGRQRVERRLGSRATDELDAQWEPVGAEASGDRDGRLTGQVEDRRPRGA